MLVPSTEMKLSVGQHFDFDHVDIDHVLVKHTNGALMETVRICESRAQWNV